MTITKTLTRMRVLTVLMTLATAAVAQTARPLKVYIKGGLVDSVSVNTPNGSIAHSRLDLSGKAHADYVSLIVTDAGGRERQYLISQVDSLVLPTGRRVVFHGGMMGQPVLARQGDGRWVEQSYPGRRRTSFGGTFPGTQGSGNVTFYWTENDHIRLDVGSESRATGLSVDHREARFTFDGLDGDAPTYQVYFPDKQVTIPSVQTQTGANNTDHVGPSGDSGTATATRQDDGSYSFELEHKAAYLCFLPHIDHLPSARLEKIVLTSSAAIAGTYQLSPAGLYNGTQTSTTVTLNLVPRSEGDFFIGHDVQSVQGTCAAYVVIAPQDDSRTFTATYHITDTLSHISKVYRQVFSFRPVANTVYPVTCHILDTEFRTIDLGLSCNWSNVNVKADEPSAAGVAYATAAEANAALLEQTVVTEWLIPDDDQRQELIAKCEWRRGEYNGQPGWFVTGASAAKEYGERLRIFLPCSTGVTPAECLARNYRPVEVLMVDLGLPTGTKWATHNVGAGSAEEYGGYYAWGEVETKDDYSSATYLYGTRNLGNNFNIAGTPYDVAAVLWGGVWRMPDDKEWEELMNTNNCTWTWTTVNGVNGYIVASRQEGNVNRIFLPAGGVAIGQTFNRLGTAGSYQCSRLGGDRSAYSYTMSWNRSYYSGTRYLYYDRKYYPIDGWDNSTHRVYGRSVRPVANPNAVTDDGIAFNIVTDSASWQLGDSEVTLYGTLTSSTPFTGNVTVGFLLGDDKEVEKGQERADYPHTVSVGGSFSSTLPVHDNIGYWYRAYVKVGDDTYFYGDARHYGFEMVDLGLESGTLWANMNIGANAPGEWGDYYAWGETQPKSDYSSATYLYGNQTLGENFDIGGTQYDAAHVLMGGVWRMPSDKAWEELMNTSVCSWEWTTEDGNAGYRVTGPSGNSIFLPAAGVRTGTSLTRPYDAGSYQSSRLGGDRSNYCYTMSWNRSYYSGTRYLYYDRKYYPIDGWDNSTHRVYGRSVRAVAVPTAAVDGTVYSVLTDSITWKFGDTSATLHGTLHTSTAMTSPLTVGFLLGDSEDVEKGSEQFDESLTVSDNGTFEKTVSVYENMGYWCRAYVKVGDAYYYGKALHYGLEMVDLGLESGTLWANMNVGASVPSGSGSYYAWGEVETKEVYTSAAASYPAQIRNLGNEFSISHTGNDAAYVVMGNSWCMPTSKQWSELMSQCTWTWTTQDGVAGFKVTGANDKYIFLPSVGYIDNTSLLYTSSYSDSNWRGGSYWSATQGSVNSWYVTTLSWRSGYSSSTRCLYETNDYNPFEGRGRGTVRYFGRQIRAVAKGGAVVDGNMLTVCTDDAEWEWNAKEATLRATLSTTRPVSGAVTVGFIVGDRARMVAGDEGVTVYEQTLTEARPFSKVVPVAGNIGQWYRAFVKVGSDYYYGDAQQYGIVMVDLGLPTGTRWASANVGASRAQDYGNYYAWGETEPKESYTNAAANYPSQTQNLGYDNNISGTLYDAATANMGADWCMPTTTQWRELMSADNCTWSHTTYRNVYGYKVTSKVNGNYIFLPDAGYKDNTSVVYDANYSDGNWRGGSYWSANLGGNNSWYANTLSWRSGYSTSSLCLYGTNDYNPFEGRGHGTVRYFGRPVRAVATPRP